MIDPAKVSVTGPLSGYQGPFGDELRRLGYARSTIVQHLRIMAHLSRWMAGQDISGDEFSWPLVRRFCSEQGLAGTRRSVPMVLQQLTDFIRPGALPSTTASAGEGFGDEQARILMGFVRYLVQERALAGRTVTLYVFHVRKFASWYLKQSGSGLASVTVSDVNRFLVGASRGSTSSVGSAAPALKAFFGWMFLDGTIRHDLAAAIGPVRRRRATEIARGLPAGQVASLLAVDASARDRAILLLLVRLGVRACEVAELKVDDFDWRAGTVRITGKGDVCQLMPVPADVGQAIAAYLDARRTAVASERHVFLIECAPYRALSRIGVTNVVVKAARQAGIAGPVGAHRLRHSAATAVLAGGGSLAEAGHLLRHRSDTVTAAYARIDLRALSGLAREWPDRAVESRARHE